jgi:cytochrome P450
MSTPTPVRLYGREFKRDPYPTYARLRAGGPVHRVEFPSGVVGWLVTGYDAAVRTLSDPRLGKNHALGNDPWRRLAAIMPEPQHSRLQVHLLHQDPPKHTVMRRLVLEALAPRRIAGLRERFEKVAHGMLDEVVGSGAADLVPAFAARFPFAVLGEVIGLPADFRRRFRREWCKVVAPVGPRSPHRATYLGLLDGLEGFIAELIASKRAHPDDADLLTDLVRANDSGTLTDAELASTIFQLLVAGQEPVTNQLTTALVSLLTRPQLLALLRADPGLLAGGVDELFRFDGAFELTTWRFFGQPSELCGVEVPEGDSVIVALDAANRDPAKFADPDTLDLSRSPNPHLAFGYGSHFCAGAALGRLELEIAIGVLIERLPGLRLAVPPDRLEWTQAVLGRGVTALPVRFG